VDNFIAVFDFEVTTGDKGIKNTDWNDVKGWIGGLNIDGGGWLVWLGESIGGKFAMTLSFDFDNGR
jgi:hypothetical protein